MLPGQIRPLRRRLLTRVSGAALIGVVTACVAAGTALADPSSPPAASGPALTHKAGVSVLVTQGNETRTALANELAIRIDGKATLVYCIDYQHPITIGEGIDYEEATWDASRVQGLEKIQWILTNSFPTVPAATVAAKAGASVDGIGADQLELLVYAATQVSIWNNSDDAVLAQYQSDKDLPGERDYQAITTIYDYLVAQADASGGHPEPKPTLKIAPGSASATTGAKAGPFTVTSGGGETTLTAEGGKLVDKDGKPVSTLKSGGQFWVTSDTAGTVTIKATGSGQVPTGRVFVAQQGPDEQQKLILAGTAGLPLTATAAAAFNAPGPQLPVTGASVTATIGAGLALLLAGAAALVIVRRRRVRFTA